MNFLNNNPLIIPAILSLLGVVYTAWASNKSKQRATTLESSIGEFAKTFAPAADVAEQFTALNKSLFKAIEVEREGRAKDRIQFEKRITDLEHSLDTERKAKLGVLEELGKMKIKISDLENQVKREITGTS